MQNGRQVFLKTFWGIYDRSVVLFVIALFWILTALPWLFVAVAVYALYPGLGVGLLVMLPLLKLNPATWAAYRYFHSISYGQKTLRFRDYFTFWFQGSLKSQLLLGGYLGVAALLHMQWRILINSESTFSWPVMALLLVQLVVYLFCVAVLFYIGPMEMFRPRPVRELAWQSFLMFFSHTVLSLMLLIINLVLGLATLRFGAMALIFVPITVVLEMNVLYYIYMKHGSLVQQPYEPRAFRELLKPFSGKISDE